MEDNIYLEILGKFYDTDRTDWMKSPFNIGNKSAATNAYSLVIVNADLKFEDRSDKVSRLLISEYTSDYNIQKQHLKDILYKYPKLDCFDEVFNTCDACNGYREVEFEFSYNKKTFEITNECPVCEGEGQIMLKSKTPNGKKEFDYEKYLEIKGLAFNLKRVEELLFVADKLNCDIIKLVHTTNHYHLFLIDDVELFLNDSLPAYKNDILYSI